jgi:hypothetical protein
MSPAADGFHPGFSPESSLMSCHWQVFWLVPHSAYLPARLNRQWYKVLLNVFISIKEKCTYSYGNSTGITPVSLLMVRC